MLFSDMIEPAAWSLASSLEIPYKQAVEIIEEAVFNSEASPLVLLEEIIDLHEIDNFSNKAKGYYRDFWDKPWKTQMRLYFDMDKAEYEEFKTLGRSRSFYERAHYWKKWKSFWNEAEKHRGRRFDRKNWYGIWATTYSDMFYGVFTKEQRRSKEWRKLLIAELNEEEIYPMKIRG